MMRGWVLLVAGVAGCVEVPDRVFVGVVDGGPDGGAPVDGDDGGGAVVVDEGAAAVDVWSGRAGDAVAGDAGEAGSMLGEDGARCAAGAWLAGVDGCLVFEALGALPVGRAGMVGAVTAAGRVWVGGGSGARGSWVLDGDGWAAGPALAVGVEGAAAAAVGEVVWVVGGEASGAAVQRVDLAAGSAAVVGALAEARVGGFSVHGAGYGVLVVGGEAVAGGVAGVERVGGGAAPGLGVARWGHAAAVGDDGVLWVVGGYDAAGAVVAGAETLAPGGLRWRPVAGGGGFAEGAAVWAGGALLAGGGVDAAGAASGAVWRFDGAGAVAAGALVHAQAGLTMTALGEGGAVLAVGPVGVEVYDPGLGAWFDVTPWVVDGARQGHVALAVDGGVVVVGGERDGRVVPTAWRARLVPAAAPGAAEEASD